MARKQPVGYVVRRPLTLWGKPREIGDRLTVEEVASLARVESLVRSGRLNEVYEETDRGEVAKRRSSGKSVEVPQPTPKPVRRKVKNVESAAPVGELLQGE